MTDIATTLRNQIATMIDGYEPLDYVASPRYGFKRIYRGTPSELAVSDYDCCQVVIETVQLTTPMLGGWGYYTYNASVIVFALGQDLATSTDRVATMETDTRIGEYLGHLKDLFLDVDNVRLGGVALTGGSVVAHQLLDAVTKGAIRLDERSNNIVNVLVLPIAINTMELRTTV